MLDTEKQTRSHTKIKKKNRNRNLIICWLVTRAKVNIPACCPCHTQQKPGICLSWDGFFCNPMFHILTKQVWKSVRIQGEILTLLIPKMLFLFFPPHFFGSFCFAFTLKLVIFPRCYYLGYILPNFCWASKPFIWGMKPFSDAFNFIVS